MEKVGRFCPKCKNLICPFCGVPEVEGPEGQRCELCGGYVDGPQPISECKWNIRAFKVDDFSHCTRCNQWFKTDATDPSLIVIHLQ